MNRIFRSSQSALHVVVASALTVLMLVPVHAAAQAAPVAELYSREGVVEFRRGSGSWQDAPLKTAFETGDEIRVADLGRAGVLFSDGVLVRLSSNSRLAFQGGGPAAPQTAAPSPASVELAQGKAHFFSRLAQAHPIVKAPTVSAAIRGTEFVVEASPDSSRVAVLEGSVLCYNSHGEVALTGGEEAVAERGKAPQKAILVNPAELVQWAIYVPPLIPRELLDGAAAADRDTLSKTLDLAQAGQSGDALGTLRPAVENGSLRAGVAWSALALAQGQIAQSETLLRRINQDAAPGSVESALAKSYLAILAVQRNSHDEANGLIRTAQSSQGNLPTVALAAAYVAQSQAALGDAEAVLEQHLARHPHDDFARARLAEIELGFGRVPTARKLLEGIGSGAGGELAYVRAVQGFVALSDLEYRRALALFNEAIERDSGMALGFFGRALARIALEDMAGGKADLEKAVQLEPRRAVYRSYLGKAFDELDREEMALKEYALGVQLDPNDPTPYLYRSFTEVSLNKPIHALRDVERSIALNENRAVYRSSLLLDQDAAVRSASLGQVFRDLGFEKAAEIEAIKSLNQDYTNYSAHRLLADANNTIFRADAGFSERRIANLLAPLSFNLFQGIGDNPSLNDYLSLFTQREQRTGLGGVFDSRDDIYAVEAFNAGKGERTGYFMGVESGFADGSMRNNYLRDYRVRGGFQYQPSYEHRFILEGGSQFREQEDDLGEPQDSELLSFVASIGHHGQVSENGTLLSQIAFDSDDSKFKNYSQRQVNIIEQTLGQQFLIEDDLLIHEKSDEDVRRLRVESQYIHEAEVVSSVTGFQFGLISADRREDSPIIDDAAAIFPGLARELESSGDNTLNAADIYSYNTFHLTRWADLIGGLTFTQIETERREVAPFTDETNEDHQFNPKVGLTLYPTDSLTLRTAYFHNLRKAALEDQVSLEPTIVGGISQRFTDLSGADSENFGLGADWKVAGSTYIGGDWITRNVADQFSQAFTDYSLNFDNGTEGTATFLDPRLEDHVDQDLVSAYIYQVITSRLAATFDYLYADQSRNDPAIDQDLELNRLSLGLRYFDPSGIFLFGRGSWREQEANGSFFVEDGTSAFWIFDAGIGYRLPHREGRVVLEFLNITDENFDYDQTLGFEPFISQEFGVRLAASWNF